MSTERIAVVGIGDDGPASLTPRAAALVARAEVLCGGHRHLRLFPEHPAERVPITADLDGLIARLRDELGRRRVTVLASGDPGYFGIGPILADRLGRDHVEIVPGVSAVSLAFARLGLSWHDATVVSAHGRPIDAAVRRAQAAQKLAILTDDTNTPAAVADALLAAGIEDAPAWVFENLGGRDERVTATSLDGLRGRTFGRLNTIVVVRDRMTAPSQLFGRSEAAFPHLRGLVTKAEVRAVSLSKLRLSSTSTLWDVGAGCGSIAIEAAGLAPNGAVFAVERSFDQLALLRQNVIDHRVGGSVTIVEGSAPAALENLPDPDAVFVGGSGDALAEILSLTHSRLRPEGRIVANLATLENVTVCIRWANEMEIPLEVVQVSISRGSAIAGRTRLAAENPVFVVTAEKPT